MFWPLVGHLIVIRPGRALCARCAWTETLDETTPGFRWRDTVELRPLHIMGGLVAVGLLVIGARCVWALGRYLAETER